MKILVIDSHKSSRPSFTSNLHWINAYQIANYLNADFIWSYPTVNKHIKENYDVIIFVHASQYTYVDYEWLEKSPNAKLYYIINEYNLGEPRTLWMDIKNGKNYTLISNYDPNFGKSKVVMKHISNWHLVNLNALAYITQNKKPVYNEKKGLIYYGSFRKDRTKYFQKYFNNTRMLVSTHEKNQEKFKAIGVEPRYISRIDWSGSGLSRFKYTLYIEDEITHKNYNHLANRFYESLNYGCIPLFDISCKNTIKESGYDIPDEYIIDGLDNFKDLPQTIPQDWFDMAEEEKLRALEDIKTIVGYTGEQKDLAFVENVNNANYLFKRGGFDRFSR